MKDAIEREEWTKDIHIQLGSGVVTVELSDEQIEYSIDRAMRWGREQVPPVSSRPRIREYAIATATMILGRIRTKFNEIQEGTSTLAGGELLLEDARTRFISIGCGPYGGPDAEIQIETRTA
jgi:hypothetical protein